VGELLCTCPRAANAQHICKHLDAATDVRPLTHAKRKAAARALLEMPVDCFVEVAERGGVLICRQVHWKKMQYFVIIGTYAPALRQCATRYRLGKRGSAKRGGQRA
jgi:hypothetical protein